MAVAISFYRLIISHYLFYTVQFARDNGPRSRYSRQLLLPLWLCDHDFFCQLIPKSAASFQPSHIAVSSTMCSQFAVFELLAKSRTIVSIVREHHQQTFRHFNDGSTPNILTYTDPQWPCMKSVQSGSQGCTVLKKRAFFVFICQS